MSKKKATGMSKRVSFMDKSVVNENRDIMRFNEQLEREARREEAKRTGVPFEEDEPKAPRMSAGRGRPPSGTGGGRSGPSRPRREGPPPGPRPGEAELLAAGEAAEGWAEFDAAGRKMADQLLRGRKPNPAARFAWELVTSAAGEDTDWDDVRRRWGVVHDAILAEWVKTHPEDAPPPPKKKPAPRAARPPRAARKPAEPQAPGAPGDARPPRPGDEVPGAVRTKRRRGGRGKRGAGGTAPGEAVTTEQSASEVAAGDVAVAGTSATIAAPTPHDPPLVGSESPATQTGTSEELAPPANPSAPPSDLGVVVTEVTDRPAGADAADVPGLPTTPAEPVYAAPLLDEPQNAAVGTPVDPGDGESGTSSEPTIDAGTPTPAPAQPAAEAPADTPAPPAAETPADVPADAPADTPAPPAAETPADVPADTPAPPAADAAPAGEAPAQPETPAAEAPAQPETPAAEAPAQPETPAAEAPAPPKTPAAEAPAQPETPTP